MCPLVTLRGRGKLTKRVLPASIAGDGELPVTKRFIMPGAVIASQMTQSNSLSLC
jgi:hypothetical protein